MPSLVSDARRSVNATIAHCSDVLNEAIRYWDMRASPRDVYRRCTFTRGL